MSESAPINEEAAADPSTCQFELMRNAIYQMHRRRFYESLNRWANFCLIMLGAGTLAKLVPQASSPTFDAIASVGVLLIGTLQLVVDIGGMARTHEFLARRYLALLADLKRREDQITPRRIAEINSKMLEIYADEPPQMRALDVIARNEVVHALGLDASELQTLTFRQRLTCQIYAWPNAHFPRAASGTHRDDANDRPPG